MTEDQTVRIAMWSGPRNISTTMLRSFENRRDTAVSDEPLYAAYLTATDYTHPLREEVMASQPRGWRDVATALTGPAPDGKAVWYQKHMTHHLLPQVGRDWIDALCNVFLLRAPEAVLASYVQKRDDVTLDEIGLPAQVELFDRVCQRRGAPPLVLDAQDVLRDPPSMLRLLCARCAIPFDAAMLAWPAGPRASDGVWAPAWYDKVERSTGFGPPRAEVGFDDLDEGLKPIAAAARPLYETLSAFKQSA